MVKKAIIGLLIMAGAGSAWAQSSHDGYQFLNIPTSSHVAALGGDNITIVDDDASLVYQNPALLSSVSDKSLSLGYTSYVAKVAGAMFTRQSGERGAWAVGAHYCNYGDFKETDDRGEILGDFKAKDISLQATYSYNLSDMWAGGVTGRFISSSYGSYSSIAAGVDLGLNYFDEETDFSASFVVRNLGGELKSFDETRANMPCRLEVGFSKRMAHAPFRISVTMTDLNHWSKDYYYNADGSDDSFKKRLMKHFVFGVDLLPSDNIYLSAGYNCRRASEMKLANGSHGAGWSFGAGMHAGKVSFGLAYAKYHVSQSSLVYNFSVRL